MLEGRRPHGAQAHARHRLQRPAGPCGPRARGGARRRQGLRLLRHRHLRHVRPGRLRAVRLVALRHGHQLRRLHGRGQGGDPRGPRDRLEGQRDGPRPPRPHLRRARDHPRPRVLRLRLRRHRRGPHRGRALQLRCPSTARPRPPATSPWPGARATTSCAPAGSSARATTSSRP